MRHTVRGADLSHVVAAVPIRSLSGGKSRLGEPLDPEERVDLVVALMRRAVTAAIGSHCVAEVLVVSADTDVLRLAAAAGAAPLPQRGDGLNGALDEARAAIAAAGRATALLVLHADLPALDAAAIDNLIERAEKAAVRGRPLVALVTDRHGSGTNALLVSPPDAIEFRFGEGSRAAHLAEAERAGATLVEIDGPLSFDVDTAEDLLLADLHGLDHEAGR